jgi:hypothetical protein
MVETRIRLVGAIDESRVIKNTQAKLILSGITGLATLTVERSSLFVVLEQKNTMLKMVC